MARRKRFRRARTFLRGSRKSYRRDTGIGKIGKILLGIAIPIGYGYVRNNLSSKLPTLPKMENYSREIILGGSALVLSSLAPKLKMVTNPIQNVEMENIGEKIALKIPLSSSSTGGTGTINTDYLY